MNEMNWMNWKSNEINAKIHPQPKYLQTGTTRLELVPKLIMNVSIKLENNNRGGSVCKHMLLGLRVCATQIPRTCHLANEMNPKNGYPMLIGWRARSTLSGA